MTYSLRYKLHRLFLFLLFVHMPPFLAFGQATSTENKAATGTIRGTVKYIADPQHPWRLGRYYIAMRSLVSLLRLSLLSPSVV